VRTTHFRHGPVTDTCGVPGYARLGEEAGRTELQDQEGSSTCHSVSHSCRSSPGSNMVQSYRTRAASNKLECAEAASRLAA
jgi:hypothetical protein